MSGFAIWITKEMISKREFSVSKAAELAKRIAEYKGCYGLLNLAYFSCDDCEEENEELFNSIRKTWEQN